MDSLKRLWKGMFSKDRDRRRSDRMPAPKLGVYYWTGAKPEQHEVRDISPTGIYIVTEERWYLGTIVKMTLQMTDSADVNFEAYRGRGQSCSLGRGWRGHVVRSKGLRGQHRESGAVASRGQEVAGAFFKSILEGTGVNAASECAVSAISSRPHTIQLATAFSDLPERENAR